MPVCQYSKQQHNTNVWNQHAAYLTLHQWESITLFAVALVRPCHLGLRIDRNTKNVSIKQTKSNLTLCITVPSQNYPATANISYLSLCIAAASWCSTKGPSAPFSHTQHGLWPQFSAQIMSYLSSFTQHDNVLHHHVAICQASAPSALSSAFAKGIMQELTGWPIISIVSRIHIWFSNSIKTNFKQLLTF